MGRSVLKKKCVFILGGGSDQLFMINTAHEMGLETAVVDGNSLAEGLKISTYSENIDFSKLDEVYTYIDNLLKNGVNICGVSTMGSDVPHLIAKISDRYSWTGPSLETGEITTNKYLMKLRLEEKGIPIPKFTLVNSPEEIKSYWSNWNCEKIVIKPTDSAGSRGVSLIHDLRNISNAFHHALYNSKIGEVIMEEYLDGLQISTESIIYNNKSITPGFADRVYEGMEGYWPQIMENGGWVPSIVTPEIKNKVCQLVESTAFALGIEKGVAKGDVVIHPRQGPMMIEMAARLSGGDFCESLVPLGTGVNYVKAAIKIALGEEPDWNELTPKFQKAVANRYFFLPPGKLETIRGIKEINDTNEISKLKFFYEPGDSIPLIENHGQRVGVMVVVDESREKVQKITDFAYNKLNFKIDGKWYKGYPKK